MCKDVAQSGKKKNNHAAFLETARFWTECYAKPEEGDILHKTSSVSASQQRQAGSNYSNHQSPVVAAARPPEPVLSSEELEKRRKVQSLVDMGFEANHVRTVLIRANWNTETALEDLLSNA
ncbi:hypothetical protein BX616_006574 [Lobosporangium transversale]|nr:hypothetical protein BX616_006574 [Lobosporangium transversale]